MEKIISFANQKGGVAKTTTTAEIGEILAKYYDKKVLLIDLDPQASLTAVKSDIKKIMEEEWKAMEDVMLEDVSIKDIILHIKPNLDLAPTTLKLSDAELTINNAMTREFILKQALEEVQDDYDYILIDCPPARGVLTVNALVASTDVILPVQSEYQALLGVQLMKSTIGLVKIKINKDLNVMGFVVTMTTHTNHSNEIADAIRNDSYKILAEIPRSIDVADAAVANVSTYEYRKDNTAGIAYYELAKMILNVKDND